MIWPDGLLLGILLFCRLDHYPFNYTVFLLRWLGFNQGVNLCWLVSVYVQKIFHVVKYVERRGNLNSRYILYMYMYKLYVHMQADI